MCVSVFRSRFTNDLLLRLLDDAPLCCGVAISSGADAQLLQQVRVVGFRDGITLGHWDQTLEVLDPLT